MVNLKAESTLENISKSSSQKNVHTWSSQTKELIDAVPRVWTRGLLYCLVSFSAIAIPWSIFAKVDQTGTAKGILEPTVHSFILDASSTSTVTEIRVQEGQRVKAGQILVKLDSETVAAELNQLQAKLQGQQDRLDRLKFNKQQLALAVNTQELENQAQKLEKQSQIQQARQKLEFLKNSYDLKKDEKTAQVNQAQQDLKYSQTALNSAETVYHKAQKEIERYQKAEQEGIIAEVQVVEQENILADDEQKDAKAKSDAEQAKLRLAEQQNNYGTIIRQAQSDIKLAQLQLKEQQESYETLSYQGELAVLKSKEELENLKTEVNTLVTEITETKSRIASSRHQLEQLTFKAPVAGTVFNLPIKELGKVVQSGEQIAEIAPDNSPLVVRGQMATAESGFLKIGMPVKLKFDAYPFQDYGVAEAKLVKISPTSKPIETEKGKISGYDLEIKLDRNCLPTSNKCIPLRPGDTATAEVIIRQRRIIDFILDPFKKLQKGGLKL